MGANQTELMSKAAIIEDDLLITGHTHLPISAPQDKFVNLGYINYGFSYYVEVENGNAFYITEKYLPRRQLISKENLFAHVAKAGPKPSRRPRPAN